VDAEGQPADIHAQRVRTKDRESCDETCY
jgi:hypothetical protein